MNRKVRKLALQLEGNLINNNITSQHYNFGGSLSRKVKKSTPRLEGNLSKIS